MKLIEFGHVVRGRRLLVVGQGGDRDSPHLPDRPELDSVDYKSAWFTREDLEANAVESRVPGKAATP